MKRNRVLRVAGYVHATLFFALMIPLLYTVAGLEGQAFWISNACWLRFR